MNSDFQVLGNNSNALFTLKIHRGEGMTLLAMNWKKGKPSDDFVGFGIEYMEPGGNQFYAVPNRLTFPGKSGAQDSNQTSSRLSPIQKFRWVHFPYHPNLPGNYTYKVTPVFMDVEGVLSYGMPQEAAIQLQRETYPGELNVAFTRGFVSSQAFVERYGVASVPTLLPAKASKGLDFVSKNPKAQDAYDWMGFEARSAILELLDQAIADTSATVSAIAYDCNEPEVVTRLEKLGKRLKMIIDDSKGHGGPSTAETEAQKRLEKSAGKANVKRQHMGNLQHNKTVIVNGTKVQAAIAGSTNLSWRGFFVQNNNAMILRGSSVVKVFQAAFDAYWASDKANDFGKTKSASWNELGLTGIKAQANFSPRLKKDGVLDSIADDISTNTTSSLFFSLAFLYQTPGPIRNAIIKHQKDNDIFSYGISENKVSGLDVLRPDGKVRVVSVKALTKNIPPPFKAEPSGGTGIHMHHKFVVIDFDQPTARVYMGSFNFSSVADTSNGENLLLLNDRRIAVAYMIEAVRIFDHYEFRLAQEDAKSARKALELALPPKSGKPAWFDEDYTNPRKIRDREIFS